MNQSIESSLNWKNLYFTLNDEIIDTINDFKTVDFPALGFYGGCKIRFHNLEISKREIQYS